MHSSGLTVTLSNAMQEYLAEAYRLAYYQNGDPYISTSSLAEVMNVPGVVLGDVAGFHLPAFDTEIVVHIPDISVVVKWVGKIATSNHTETADDVAARFR